MIYENLLDAIGQTPLVAVKRMNPYPRVKILAKLEAKNVGGSIKDRVALSMIQRAEALGEIGPNMPGKVVIEATSGNTGIGLAMVCAVKGYPLRLLMPATASEERRKIMLAYGADIQLTPGHLSTDGAIEEAYRLAREEPETYVLMDQFNNPASIDAHYNGTGLEIWEQTEGTVTHVVLTLGTSGTAMGVAKRIHEMSETAKVVAVEPSPGHKLQGLKNMQESYPPGIYDKKQLDEIVGMDDGLAYETARRLAREEGILAGMSSGAAMAAALRLAGELDERGEEGTIVVILPDGGERYLSTPLYTPKAEAGATVFDMAAKAPTVLVPRPGFGKKGQEAGLGFFTMGPPLDRLTDLSSWRRILALDSLAVHISGQGIPVRVSVGIADMDDRAMEGARAAGLSRQEYSNQALAELREMARRLDLSPAVSFHAAGAHVSKILDISKTLLAKGAAYEKMRSVYVDVTRVEGYGALSGMDVDKANVGATVDLEDYTKSNPTDFTLLKRASLQDLKAGEALATDWGNVRPSWFMQMAAVALDTLPELSLFLGDAAHVFPHMENFRAIFALGARVTPQAFAACQSVTGSPESADETAAALLAQPGLARMFLLSAARRKSLALSEESLGMWRKNQARVQHLAADLAFAVGMPPREGAPNMSKILDSCSLDTCTETTIAAVAALVKSVQAALEQDLALNRVWPALFAFAKDVQAYLAKQKGSEADGAAFSAALSGVDAVLKVLDRTALPLSRGSWPEDVAAAVAEREAARKSGDFDRADSLRDTVLASGFRLEDTPDGPRVFPA